MNEILRMWKYPKMILLTALIAVLYGAILIPFKSIVLVPGFTELRPGSAFPVVAGLLFGPAGALGSAFGNLIGDLFGTFGWGSLFGFFGNFALATVPYKLWDKLGLQRNRATLHPESNWAKAILNYLLVAILGSLASALIIPWGLALLGLQPFALLAILIGLNNLLMTTLLGGVTYFLIHRRIHRMDLHWTRLMPPEEIRESGDHRKEGGLLMAFSILIGFPLTLGVSLLGYPMGVLIIGALAIGGILIGALLQR